MKEVTGNWWVVEFLLQWFWSLSYRNNVILYVDFHCSADVCHLMVQGKTWKCDSASLLCKCQKYRMYYQKFSLQLKQQNTVGFCFLYFWHLTMLTFPTEGFWVTVLEVLSSLRITRLIPDSSQLCLCNFQTIKFGPFWGGGERGCNLPQTSRINYCTYIHFTDNLQHPIVECVGDRQHQFLFFCHNKHDSSLQIL